VKRKTGRRRGFATRIRAAVMNFLSPGTSLPCVGLVVLGGCLTFMVLPDDMQPAALHSDAESRNDLPTIVIDAGHGGRDEGTKWRGVSEKDLTLDLAYRVDRLLKSAGFPTRLTRRDNQYIALEDRVRLANKVDDALFVSLHFNSDGGGSSSGIETFYARQKAPPETEWTWIGFFNRPEAPENDTSEVLAGAIQASLTTRTEARNRGIHPSRFYVVHHTRHPAVLVECGFLSNVFEMQMISNVAYRDRLAEGIVEGVMSYQKLRSRPNRSPALPRIAKLEMR
jgi:N-acetylmuramoyl-L-alanine amidase